MTSTSDSPVPARPADGEHWLAVDANPYLVRLVLVADGAVLRAFEAKRGPNQVKWLLQFVRDFVPPGTTVTGRFYDRWPPDLHSAVVQRFGPVFWINPTFLNRTLPDVDDWRRKFSSYRALFFATCAEATLTKGPLSWFADGPDVLDAWKSAVLYDLMASVEPEAVADTHPTGLLTSAPI